LSSNPDTVAFGRDKLAVFTKSSSSGNTLVDVVVGPRKQTQTVEGLENLEQAIALLLQTRRGANKAHPDYGTSTTVGRPYEPNNVAMYVFYVRQALMADPRISAVENPKITYIGTSLFFEIDVRPIRTQKTLFFRIPL
jgi:phage baseplate assembly protein W